LTTDTNAPTRSDEATKTSVEPSSETTRGPPPAESTRPPRVPPTRSARPPATVDTSYTLGVDEPASATQSPTPVQSTPTGPRGGPPTGPPRGGPPTEPPQISSVTITQRVTETIDLGYDSPGSSGQTTFATLTRQANETFTYSPSGSVSYCQPSDLTAVPTSWSVVYTSTITWYGNPEDYTPPYSPISVPQTSSCVIPIEPPKLTISICASTGTDTEYKTCEVTTTTQSYQFGVQTSATPAVVFITTDKNPAVVFTNIDTPNYGVSQGPKTHDDHASPTNVGGGNNPPPAYDDTTGGPQAITQPGHRPPPSTPITVGVQPTAIVIDGNTIHDNPAQPTQVVIIADQTFTIDPTRVVGGGATIDRPAATGGIYVPTPTSTNLGGIPVVISSSVAVIGGSSFTLGGSSPTTATISGQTFTINPSNIAGASQTVAIHTLPRPTEVVVAGGDLITAIGRSVLVIHGTTITYFPSGGGGTPSPPTTLIVDGETLTLGPGGVTAHGGALTIGGSQASSPHDTQYALVGGATITKIGASVVVIRDVTYTVGPGTGTTTTLIGGESVTIAPGGVEVGTLSLGFPFGVTTVITPGAGPTAGGAMATAGAGDEEEDGVGAVRPGLVGVGWGVGVALAVGVVV
jgi:hypothetical protein